MVQTERGLMSGCQCPDCGNVCRDCMGSVEAPMSPDQLRARFESGALSSAGGDMPRAALEEPPEWAERIHFKE